MLSQPLKDTIVTCQNQGRSFWAGTGSELRSALKTCLMVFSDGPTRLLQYWYIPCPHSPHPPLCDHHNIESRWPEMHQFNTRVYQGNTEDVTDASFSLSKVHQREVHLSEDKNPHIKPPTLFRYCFPSSFSWAVPSMWGEQDRFQALRL